jgi:hypothetical protein
MTIENSGALGLNGTCTGGSSARNQIGAEVSKTAGTQLCINNSCLRTLSGTSSGTQVSFSTFYGKSNRVNISSTFSSNTANASLNLSGIGGYISGKSDITVTVNSGVYLYATSTGNYGLSLTGATTGDTVTLVNNGYIAGQGGTGATGNCATGNSGNAGGGALNISGVGVSSVTINNTNGSAYIGGGGGGGSSWASGGGGGAGGGTGGSSRDNTPGGAGGGVGSKGANGQSSGCASGGGGGGRIFPGCGGAKGACSTGGYGGGAGGGGGCCCGGAGGAANNPGSDFSNHSAGGGGGWGASGGSNTHSGGAGGKAVNLGGKTAVFVSCNKTRVWGSIS